jgi:hypothetical protein
VTIDAPHTTPCVYLIPAGFTGWVTIEYGVAGAPPLAHEGEARCIDVPASGRVETSSAQELGIVGGRTYYFVDAAGARTPIDEPEARYGAAPDEAYRAHDHVVVLANRAGATTDASGRHYHDRFYVGTGPVDD